MFDGITEMKIELGRDNAQDEERVFFAPARSV